VPNTCRPLLFTERSSSTGRTDTLLNVPFEPVFKE